MTTPSEEFEAALAGDEPDFDSPPPEGLDLDQATQWLAQLARIRRLRAEYLEAHGAAIKRLSKALGDRMAALDEQEAWFEEALAIYHAAVLAADKDAKTIVTPAGKLIARKGQTTWVYDDEAAFEAWAQENLPQVFSKPKPAPAPTVLRNEVKKALKGSAEEALKVAGTSDAVLLLNGATVPGLHVEPGVETFKAVTGDE